MKKNLRIVSVAAAALLAVAPVATSVVSISGTNVVQAATSDTISGSVITGGNAATGNTAANQGTTTNIANAPTNRPFFARNYQAIGEATQDNPNANVVRQTVSISVGETTDKIAQDLKGLNIVFHPSVNSTNNTPFAPSASEVENLLKNVVTFETSSNKSTKGKRVVKTLPNGDFNLTVDGKANNQTATIQIPFVVSSSSNPTDVTGNPVISYTVGNQAGKSENPVFQVAANSQFNPLAFNDASGNEVKFNAVQASGSSIQANLTATSNPVDTSQQGRFYNVTLTATNLNGKTKTFTYTVLITSSQKQQLYGNGTINTYNIYGNNALNGSITFKSGDTVYVDDATKTINGVSYSQVSPKSKADAATSNVWVRTADLTKPAVTETSETHTVMVASKAYDKSGKYLGHDYGLYTSIDIVPTVETINGKTYYKVAGKDEYVRVTNITGTRRTLRHNAYIYWSSYRRTPGTGKMYKGQTVTTYGASIKFKNGKKYYRIQGCRNDNKRYIKAANF